MGRAESKDRPRTDRPMTDIFEPRKRSEIMSRVRSRDTKPELVVRRIAHGLGFRFRLHRRDLPGSPDLVFPRHRAVIMVHGVSGTGVTAVSTQPARRHARGSGRTN